MKCGIGTGGLDNFACKKQAVVSIEQVKPCGHEQVVFALCHEHLHRVLDDHDHVWTCKKIIIKDNRRVYCNEKYNALMSIKDFHHLAKETE